MPEEISMEELVKGCMAAQMATAEVLKKMDERIEAAEAAEAEEREAAEEEEMRKAQQDNISSVVKSTIAEMLPEIVKTVNMELNADKEEKVSGTKWPMSSNPPGEDQEEKTTLRTGTGEVQKPIQASEDDDEYEEKADEFDDDVDEDMEDVVEDVEDVEEDVEEEYPMEEKAYGTKMGKMPTQMAGMAKMIKKMQKERDDLRKENSRLTKGMEKEVNKQLDSRLSQLGFKVEKSKKAKFLPMSGQPDLTNIKKSKGNKGGADDAIDALVDKPWNELWEMRIKAKSGDYSDLQNLMG